MIKSDISNGVKMVLIHSPVDTEKTLGKLKKLNPSVPPIGVASLAGYLRANGVETAVIDAYKDGLSPDETIKRFLKCNAEIIGLSVSTPGAPIACRISREIKKIKPETIVIFGGVHPTLMPKETMDEESIDFVVRGEGEITLLELLKEIGGGGKNLEAIKGISYRKNGGYRENISRPTIENLDALPFPAWDLFDLKSYTPPPHWDLGRPFVSIPLLRGCPHRCSFCCLPLGKFPRFLSPSKAAEQIEWLVKNFGIKTVMISPLFPGGKLGAEFCQKLIEKGLNKKISWLCEFRVDYADLELLKLMKRAGCKRLAFGIESGNQKILDNIKKGITLKQAENAVRLAKKIGIEIIAYFIIGLPGETKETARQTIDFAKKLNPDYVKFNLAVPYPGTELYDEAVKKGLLKSRDWERFTSFSSMTGYEPIFTPEGMITADLMKLQKQALKEFYFRPSYILKRLLKLKSGRELINIFNAARTLFNGIMK